MRAIEPLAREAHPDPLIALTRWLRASKAGAPTVSMTASPIASMRWEALPIPRDAQARVDHLVDEGVRLLLVEIDETPVVDRALIALLTSKDAGRVYPPYQPTTDSVTEWRHQTAEISAAIWKHREALSDMESLASDLGASRVNALALVMLTAAARSTPMVIAGVGAVAAALVAQRLNRHSTGWMALAARTGDPAIETGQGRLGLPTVLHGQVSDEVGASALVLAHAQINAMLSI